MSLPRLAGGLAVRQSGPLLLRASVHASGSRYIASSSFRLAQVQDDKPGQSSTPPPEGASSTDPDPPKLGKKARKALRAAHRKQMQAAAQEAKDVAKAERMRRHEEDQARISREAKEAREQRKAEAEAKRAANAPDGGDDVLKEADPSIPIVKVKHVVADGKGKKMSEQEIPRVAATEGWSGSMFSKHISSLLSGFGTAPKSQPSIDSPAHDKGEASSSSAAGPAYRHADAAVKKLHKRLKAPNLTKSERMESQARVIFQAIREARERGIVDEDESFFYPYPEGVPPKDVDGEEAVWLNLGPDPEAWGRDIPPVKDRWLEVLSLGLTKQIGSRKPPITYSSDGAEPEEHQEDDLAFDDLVEDYDLEDHERLEQLGDSIVNMSSRLLAYLSYPDVNEGSLTRLSNYPTQNNFLALLFQECGLAARRDELTKELRRAHDPNYQEEEVDKKGENAEEDTVRLPLLIKRDADMFEAYVAAVFLSHGSNFNVVHEWLCHLFRPFQDQAYRFMVQRSEALARLQAQRAAAAAAKDAATKRGSVHTTPSPTNLYADGLGIKSASLDPSSVAFSSLFPDFAGKQEKNVTGIPSYALNNSTSEAFITDEFLTVAARARRQREERLREELRV